MVAAAILVVANYDMNGRTTHWSGSDADIAVATFLVFRLQGWYRTAGRPGQTQSVSVQTKETPSQNTLSATCAAIWIILITELRVILAWSRWRGPREVNVALLVER